MNNFILRVRPEAQAFAQVSVLADSGNYLPNLGIMFISPEQWFRGKHLLGKEDILSVHEAGYFNLPDYCVEKIRTKGQYEDNSEFTWGLQAIHFPNQPTFGEGAKVCVLDTGLDISHPDLQHVVKAESMVKGVKVQDTCGHGTHCAGTIAGLAKKGPQYGVAPECSLYVGKVFGDGESPGAYEEDILRGIEFAVANRCDVISMSLGSYRGQGQAPKALYEQLASDLFYGGAVKDDPNYTCLLLAAAGNSSNRPKSVAPIGNPAACRGFHAIAAVDSNLEVAYFSCGNTDGMSPLFGSGPGVNVYSSWLNGGYKTISGTSMATPHAAGVAAVMKSLLNAFEMDSSASSVATCMQFIVEPLGNIRDYGPGLLHVGIG